MLTLFWEMVTIQEVEQRESQLKEVEQKARVAAQTKVPQRRYGAGITPQEQRQSYQTREEGKRVLGKVAEQRKELSEVRKQVIKRDKRQAQIDAIRAQQQEYKQGYQAGLKGAPPFGLSDLQRQGYVDARNNLQASKQRSQYISQIKELEAQGLEPVIEKNKIVGFLDTEKGQSIALEAIPQLSQTDLARYERAGFIERVTMPTQTTFNLPGQSSISQEFSTRINTAIQSKQMSTIPKTSQKEYNTLFGKAEKAIQFPFKKASEGFEKVVPEKQTTIKIPKVALLFTPTYYALRYSGDTKEVVSGDIKRAGEFLSYPTYGAKRVEEVIRYKEARVEFASLSKTEKAFEVTNIGLSLYTGATIAKSGAKFLREPITIKTEPKLPTKNLAKTDLKIIRSGERTLNVAQFEVTSINAARRAYQIPRYEALLRGFKTNDVRLEKYSIEQLKVLTSQGKTIEISKVSISQSITEPFIIREGKITKALGRKGKPAVFSYRSSISETGQIRFSSKRLGLLSGESYEAKAFKTLSQERTELPKNLQKALDEIITDKGLNIKVLDKELKLQSGNVELKNLLKINTKGIKGIPEGKRISRAEVAAIQKSFFKEKFTYGSKYGLTEREILGEKIGAVDTTFPRLRAPKKATKIEGIVEKLQYEIPEAGDLGSVKSTGEVKSIVDKKTTKTIQEAIGSVAIKQNKLPTPKVQTPKTENILEPVTKNLPGITGAAIQKTETLQQSAPPISQNVQMPKAAPSYALKNIPSIKNIPIQRSIPKGVSKEITKDITKNITKSLPKLAPKQISKQVSKSIPKSISKFSPKTQTTRSPITPSSFPRISTQPKSTRKTPLIKLPKLGGESKPKNLVTGYKPFVIKGGEKVYLEGILTKGSALKKAEEEAKKSLRATFGVEKTSKQILGDTTSYTPSKKLFRSYRIRGGKRIALQDTFIQRKGKRLVSGGEIAEIQQARKLKAPKIKLPKMRL